MKKTTLLILATLMAVFLFIAVNFANAETYDLQNTWALGIDNVTGCPGDINSGWVHSETVSLSRCYKNPSPDAPNGGAAFKNGPKNGLGQAGIETTSSQTFILPYSADGHELTFSALIICVRCDYLIAELYGDGQYLGELLHYTEGIASCGEWGWQRYCGEPLTIPQANEYEIVIRSLWTESNSLGVKWTGLELTDMPLGPMPTPTDTPEPTATAVYLPLVLEPGNYELQCPGTLIIDSDFVTCEAGN